MKAELEKKDDELYLEITPDEVDEKKLEAYKEGFNYLKEQQEKALDLTVKTAKKEFKDDKDAKTLKATMNIGLDGDEFRVSIHREDKNPISTLYDSSMFIKSEKIKELQKDFIDSLNN